VKGAGGGGGVRLKVRVMGKSGVRMEADHNGSTFHT